MVRHVKCDISRFVYVIPFTIRNSPSRKFYHMNNFQYAQFARNEYSQFGEDGIIEHVLEIIPNKDNWCVECGAWDGIHLSNTFNLIKNKGYRAVLIEADKNKFKELQKNLAPFDAVLVNKFVTFDGVNTLDKILGRTSIPKNFDFLSIDIDGNDYWIFDSLVDYRPKVICIEYNPSIPNEVEYVQPRNFSVKKGASASSICKLAKQKSYELIATTSCNLIFVDKALFHLFQIGDNQLASLRDDSHCRIFAFVGYDGTIIHSKPIHFYWHDFTIYQEELQALPRFLRTFPSDYSALQKLCFVAFLFVREPMKTLRRVRAKLRSRGTGK